MRKIASRPFFIKLYNWEYWPFTVVYGPVYIYWLWLCIRSRAVFFFNAANPSIKNGGFLLESKKEIYDLIPAKYYPGTLLFEKDISENELVDELKTAALSFPCIGKPDIGMRGMAVKKLDTLADILVYARDTKVNFLVQEFIPLENEVGIFYYRLPGEKKGYITGIVGKEFLTVKGDGQQTIDDLL